MRSTSIAGAAACALALAAGGSAAAKPVPVDLHVEGADNRVLTADRYLTDTTRVRTDRDCGGSGQTKRLSGPTALGALVDAGRSSRRLFPLAVSDEFSFGLLVCGVGDDVASDSSSFWLYKVNHVSPEVGGDGFAVEPGDELLWYFSDTGANTNTGDELDLVAPARARRGAQFEVKVYAYDAAGRRRPIEGALVTGGAAPARSGADGIARVEVGSNSTVALRASLEPHVSAAPVEVCVNRVLSRCASARGERIHGSARSERIAGTAGPDVVRAGPGRDRIAVRKGARDRVNCGGGRDLVLAGRRDEVARNCEVVRRRGRS